MNKHLLLLMTLAYFSCSTNKAQTKSVINAKAIAIAKIEYTYKFKPRKYLLEQTALLYLSNSNSLFVTAKGNEEFVMIDGEQGQDGYVQDIIGDLIYKDFSKNNMQIREKIWNKAFTTNEDIPKFKWIITKETKKIGTFDCILATTTFRGRTYNAWYAAKIPFSDGPWKFNGLPGLILQVYDAKMEYQFIVKSIKMPVDEVTSFEFNDDGKALSYSDFIKIEDVEFEKSRKQAELKWDGQGTFKMTKMPSNPIELNFNK